YQLPDQVPPRVLFLCLFFGRLLMHGQQAAALDINQVRRHQDKFPSDLKVEHPESLEILKILAGDSFDWNVVNVDLIFPDKIEQEVKRSLENLQLHFVISLHQSEFAMEVMDRLR